MSFFETIRRKPESTRRLIAVVIFFCIMGIVFTGWLWQTTGTFPYENIANAVNTSSNTFQSIKGSFQNMREKMGEIKAQFLEPFSDPQLQPVNQ